MSWQGRTGPPNGAGRGHNGAMMAPPKPATDSRSVVGGFPCKGVSVC